MKTWKATLSLMMLFIGLAMMMLLGGNIYYLIISILILIATLVLVLIKPGGNLMMINQKRKTRNLELKLLWAAEQYESNQAVDKVEEFWELDDSELSDNE